MSDYEDDFDDDSPKKPQAGSWLQPVAKPAAPAAAAAARSPTPAKSPRSPVSSRSSRSSRSSPRRYSSRSSRSSRRSSPRASDAPSPAKTSWDASPQHVHTTAAEPGPTPVKEIALLRLKNAELQRAIDAVRSQLSKIAPRLSANVKRKHSTENERMNRLQQESAMLQQEQAALMKKLRDVEHVKELEKQLAAREAEVKALQERNKFLQLEIRNNAKRLKHAATIEEHRAQVLTEIKQERKLAITALEKAQRDAELALQSKETAQKRLTALESRDRLPELKPEDVKQLLEMKTALNEKIETIESLQYRLSVLKRAHESVHRTTTANPAELAEVETLKAEVTALRAALAAADSRPAPKAKPVDAKKKDEKVRSGENSEPKTTKSAPAAAAADVPRSRNTAEAEPKKQPSETSDGTRTRATAESDAAPKKEPKTTSVEPAPTAADTRKSADNEAAIANRNQAHAKQREELQKDESTARSTVLRDFDDGSVSLQSKEEREKAEIVNRRKTVTAGRRASQDTASTAKPPAAAPATAAPPPTTEAAKSDGPSWLDD